MLCLDQLAEREHAALQRLLEDGFGQGVLALEELVERVQRQLRTRDDLLDRELERAAFRDQVECRVDQQRGAMFRTGACLLDGTRDREVTEALGLRDRFAVDCRLTD